MEVDYSIIQYFTMALDFLSTETPIYKRKIGKKIESKFSQLHSKCKQYIKIQLV